MRIPIIEDELILFPEADVLQEGQHRQDAGTFFGSRDEGQLAVDVLETDAEIVLRSAIAAVKPEDLEVFVQNDMLTVRGNRAQMTEERDGGYLIRECHWGAFSRSIILPSEVDADRISAELKNGVLTVRMPKTRRSRKIAIKKT